jgi:hypothetical protein
MDIYQASSLVGGILESRIPDMLNGARDHTWDSDHSLSEFEFRRFEIGFPDVELVKRSDPSNVIFQIEAKSWYALSSDTLSARFKTSQSVLREGTLLVIVAWMLDGVVSGSPKFMRVFADDAIRLANARDAAWNDGRNDHRVDHPVVDPSRTLNLQQTSAIAMQMNSHGDWVPESQNFGKIDRFHDPAVNDFTSSVLEIRAAGRSLKEWKAFIKRGETVTGE